MELITRAGQLIPARARNLSRGGLCLEIATPVAAGEDVDVRITLVFDVDRSSEPLRLPARIVWCTPIGDDVHQVGTQFRPLSSDQNTYLDMFLRYLEEPGRAAAQAGDAGGGDDEEDPFA